MPLYTEDEINRLIDARIKRAQKPLEDRASNHSLQLRRVTEEVPAPVRAALRDSRADIDDQEAGREQLIVNSLAQFRSEVAARFQALERGQTLTEGKATALIANSDDADKLRQKNGKKLTGAIVLQALTVAGVIASIIERLLQ